MERGLSAVIFESNCRRLPAAAFLGLANAGRSFFSRLIFNFLKSFLFIKTSPLTSSKVGAGLKFERKHKGIALMVFKF